MEVGSEEVGWAAGWEAAGLVGGSEVDSEVGWVVGSAEVLFPPLTFLPETNGQTGGARVWGAL